MILDFAGGSVGTKVPLLPHNFMEGLAIIGRPPQRVLLRSFNLSFDEIEPNPRQVLRRLKMKPDRLWTWAGCAPSRTRLGQQGALHRIRESL